MHTSGMFSYVSVTTRDYIRACELVCVAKKKMIDTIEVLVGPDMIWRNIFLPNQKH